MSGRTEILSWKSGNGCARPCRRRRAARKNIRFNGAPLKFLGKPVAPDANQFGGQETVRVNPWEVMRVGMRFDLAAVPFAVPLSSRTGVAGHEFV